MSEQQQVNPNMSSDPAANPEQPDVSTSQEVVVKSDLPVGPKNNIVAYLDPSTRNAANFSGIIEFLKRSRIFKAISTECTAYKSHQQEFWRNVTFFEKETPAVLKSSIFGKEITVTAEVIRNIVGFEDSAECPVFLNKYLVRGLFLRVKYVGDIQKGVLGKSGLCPQYKYLAHVLQLCLSPRRAGHDDMRESIQAAFAALVLNIPYNFSAMIFSHLVENITSKKEAYLMYPRFLQMIINAQAPDLPKDESDIIEQAVMNDLTMNRLMSYKSKAGGEPTVRPPAKRLIGHLANPNYVFPGGKKWRHDESDSDREDLLVEGSDSDDGDEQVEAEDIETTSAAAANLGKDTQEQSTAQSVPGEGHEARKKRVRSEGTSGRSLVEYMSQKMARKRKKFVYKALPRPAPQAQTQQTQPPPVESSIPVQPSPAAQNVGASQAAIPDQMNILNSLVMRLMNDQREQADQMKKLIEDNRRLMEGQASKDAVIEAQQNSIEGLTKMVNEQAAQISSQQNLLLATTTELNDLKDEYKTFQASLQIGGDGVLRIGDKDDDEDVDEAGPSQPREG